MYVNVLYLSVKSQLKAYVAPARRSVFVCTTYGIQEKVSTVSTENAMERDALFWLISLNIELTCLFTSARHLVDPSILTALWLLASQTAEEFLTLHLSKSKTPSSQRPDQTRRLEVIARGKGGGFFSLKNGGDVCCSGLNEMALGKFQTGLSQAGPYSLEDALRHCEVGFQMLMEAQR